MKAWGLSHVPNAELLDIVAVCAENVGAVAPMVVVVAILGVLLIDRPAVRHEVDSTKQSLSRTSMTSNSKL